MKRIEMTVTYIIRNGFKHTRKLMLQSDDQILTLLPVAAKEFHVGQKFIVSLEEVKREDVQP
jgi:hypothetical protein